MFDNADKGGVKMARTRFGKGVKGGVFNPGRPPFGRHQIQTETVLWIDNTEPLYNQKISFFNNYCRKLAKGKFNRQLAKKGFRHLTTFANQSYKQQIKEPLPISDRKVAENELLKDFRSYVRDGDCPVKIDSKKRLKI